MTFFKVAKKSKSETKDWVAPAAIGAGALGALALARLSRGSRVRFTARPPPSRSSGFSGGASRASGPRPVTDHAKWKKDWDAEWERKVKEHFDKKWPGSAGGSRSSPGGASSHKPPPTGGPKPPPAGDYKRPPPPPGGGGYTPPPRPPPAPANHPEWLKGVKTKAEAKAKYRDMAKQHHPDRGGDTRKMQDINSEWDKFQKHPDFSKLSHVLGSFFDELSSILS